MIPARILPVTSRLRPPRMTDGLEITGRNTRFIQESLRPALSTEKKGTGIAVPAWESLGPKRYRATWVRGPGSGLDSADNGHI